MANLLLNEGEQLIFDNNDGADSYLTQLTNDRLQRVLNGTLIDEAELIGTAPEASATFTIRNRRRIEWPLPAGVIALLDSNRIRSNRFFIPQDQTSSKSSSRWPIIGSDEYWQGTLEFWRNLTILSPLKRLFSPSPASGTKPN